MKINRLFFIILLMITASFSSCMMLVNLKAKKMGYEGHFDRHGEWVNTPSYVYASKEQAAAFDTSFNLIPFNRLYSIQAIMDSDIYARQCYKFIQNTDSTKFLALFTMAPDDPAYATYRGNRHTITSYYSNDLKDSIEYFNYALWGMLYEHQWYYYYDHYTEFYAPSFDKARNKFIVEVLCKKNKFFKYYQTPQENEYWLMGGEYKFQDNSNGRFEPVSKEKDSVYAGLPLTVVNWIKYAGPEYARRKNEHQKEQLVITSITAALQQPLLHAEIIYNADTTLFLVQVVTDSAQHMNFAYYLFNMPQKKLFLWTDEPPKEIADIEDCGLFFERDLNKRFNFKMVGFDHRIPDKRVWSLFTADVLREIPVP